MAIPSVLYPQNYDADNTLYAVKDSAYLQLAQDYNPGDRFIYFNPDDEKAALFPPSGIITLVEQCSDPNLRATSYFYANRTSQFFYDLTILDGFTDTYKPSKVTNIVMNVMAEHHNNIKDALINIQQVVGLQDDEEPVNPNEGNLVQRIKYLKKVAYTPIAWFVADKNIGLVPLKVNFTSQSVRLGESIKDNNIEYLWDFGDGTTSTQGPTVSKTYTESGIYSVSLTVRNKYGEDTFELIDFVDVKFTAPEVAVLNIIPSTYQNVINGQFKTPINMNISLLIPSGENPNNLGYSYSGEKLDPSNFNNPFDPITTYTWSLADDYFHADSMSTQAIYSRGGLYQPVLRVDTESEAYRITKFTSMLVGRIPSTVTTTSGYLNVVERTNAWLFTFVPCIPNTPCTTQVRANEMGFISETFKTQNVYYPVSRNPGYIISTQTNIPKQLQEFNRNTAFTPKTSVLSGLGGEAAIYWASGRGVLDPISLETINAVNFNAFEETYANITGTTRPWNWTSFAYQNKTYFIFGNPTSPQPPGLSLTNLNLAIHNPLDLTWNNTRTFTSTSFIGSASELTYNAAVYDNTGKNLWGNFSTYRTTIRNENAYILKNTEAGDNFSIKSFYRSVSDGVNLIGTFEKLLDIAGPKKLEGILLNLKDGIFFFNNTGSVSQYDTNTATWKVGGPGQNSVTFNDLQDTNVLNYANEENTLVGTTNNDYNAYLSYDYSNNAYLKFNAIDLTFSKLDSRPSGEQWIFGNY